MSISLNWEERKPSANLFEEAAGTEREHVVYSAIFNEGKDKLIERAVQACIEKAVSFIPDNVTNESRYFLFEWDVVCSTLTIVVTDDSKENDSKIVVKCLMSVLDENTNTNKSESAWSDKTAEYAQLVKYWIKDYLTTCSDFMKFSLVAVFHSESRENTELL